MGLRQYLRKKEKNLDESIKVAKIGFHLISDPHLFDEVMTFVYK